MKKSKKTNKPPLPPYLKLIAQEINYRGFRGWLLRELAKSFEEARKNKRKTHNEHDFEIRWPQFICNLTTAVLEQHYRPCATSRNISWPASS